MTPFAAQAVTPGYPRVSHREALTVTIASALNASLSCLHDSRSWLMIPFASFRLAADTPVYGRGPVRSHPANDLSMRSSVRIASSTLCTEPLGSRPS